MHSPSLRRAPTVIWASLMFLVPHFGNGMKRLRDNSGEGHRLEVRAEAFNVTNGLRLGNPGVSLANLATFGQIRSAAGGGRVMQFALKYIF